MIEENMKAILNKLKGFTPSAAKRNLTGFTLIEVLIAVALLGVGILGSAVMFSSTFKSMRSDKNEAVALNLAQEGLSMIETVRDENWLKTSGCDGTSGACPDGRIYADCSTDPNCDWRCNCGYDAEDLALNEGMRDLDYRMHVERGSGDAGACNADGITIYKDNNNNYGHNTGEPTIFKRLIKVETGTDLNQDGATSNDISVQSIVCWEDGGEQNKIVLEEYLFNWANSDL